MANPNDNLRRLYQNGLKHFSLPDFDTFQQDMRDEEKRKRFYNNMQGAYSLPDFDTFSQDIGAVTPPPAQPQAQAQPQQTTSTVKPVTDNTAQQASVQPTVQTSSQPAQPEGWKPTPMQQRAFQMQMDEANARLKKQGEEFKQRMEGIEKGNRPGAFMGEREFNPQTGKMETHYYTTQGERVGTRMEQSHANTEYHNWWENNTEAGKRSKEQRLQREFDEKLSYLWQRHNPAEGENAAEQAWSAAESAYNAKAERNREAANFNVQNFAMNSTDAVAFKQMETVDNFTDRLTTHDMDVLMDNAWNNLGEEGQKSLIDDCYQMLRRRNPGVDDLVLYGKAKEFARQQSDLRMYHLAVEKNLPKSNLEYFMRKVGDMNLVTNIGKGIAVNRVKKTGDMAAYEAANEQYRQDGHKILDVAGTVTGFALDPTTWMSAGVGGMATRGAMWAGGRVLAGRGATAAVTNAATRQFATSMTGRVIGGIAGGAANFGTFEGIKEMETQFAHGGHIVGQDDTGRYLNEGYSASAVAGQAAHGFLMGGAIGWLTPVSGNVADKLVRSTSSTGLKVMERAGVYSGATMLEGTIFSVPEWIEGNRDAMDVWTDNMAMMVGFKAKHMIKSAGNVLGDLKASFDSPTNGRKNRLDFESRLRQRMDAPSDGGLSLTKDEAAELSKHGYGDLRELVESAERTGDATKGELITANAPEIVSRLTDMVTDPRISEAARAKMYYYATGRKLPESTVMKGELIEDGEGGFIVESQGANGVITSRSFKSRKAADLELERIKRQTELNHIEIGERYQQTADFENRLQEACRTVAAENGWDMVEVYRTCEEARRNNLRGGDKQFDEAQQNILRKVTEAMGEFEETSVTDNMRGRINDKYGVDIDNAIRKEANRRTIAEQTAIDEYLDELIPKNAKERNTVEDAEAEDITNQKLLTDEPEATTPTNDAPIDPRFDNPTTPEYDPHQPGGEQKPVGRAVMKYQDRPVEVLSGRVVMMEDGTMIDNERSDASIVVRDLETGKVEMVSPDAILSYEGYPAEVEVPQDNVAPEAETPAEPQPKYTTGQIKIRNSDGTETRGVLTGFVDENGNHEYYVEGDLQQLHYASEHELDNILSEYTPDEPQEVKQPQPAEPQPVDPNRPTQEGVANVEDYDKGYSFGIDETQGISDSELTAKISELRTDAERLTDFGRGMLEAYEYEQQRRAMEQQLVPVDAETVPKTEETTLNPMETGVNITETVPKTEIPIENVQQSVDDGNVVVPAPATNEAPQVDNVSQPDLTAQAEPTPLQRIPRNEKNEPIFEQAESPEVGWDALVEFSEGDAATAKEIADTMVEEKRKAFEKAQKLKPKGKTPTEILASKKANTAELTKAQAEYEQWQRMAGVENARQSAIRSQQEVEARRLAAERAEAEKAEREAREEAARLEREALEGIPEWHMDTPENARKRGVRRFSGQMFTRQEPVQGVVGNEVEVKFSQKDLPKGRVAVIEASQLQPSHVQGQRNPMFFIEEAQPKNRTEAVSMFAAKEMAEGIRPKEITGSVTAYTGAPTVNTRGEVIQGNNRSDALRYLWQSNLPQQQQTYKQYLIDNAEQFGIDPEAVNAMQNPVLVNMLDVDDAEAIRLGQMTAQDTESGGIERIKPKNVAQTLGDNMRTFANMLLSSGEEDVSFGQLVDRNGTEVMKWMNQVGAISNTQFQSAFDSKSNLTAEAKNDLQKVLYQAVFKGASQQLEEMFDKLPAKAQRAILATAFRDMDSPFAGKMLPEIQASIIVYNQLMSDPTFANAKKMEEVLKAVEAFKQTIALDDRFEHYMPADNFSNFALHLAAMYKATDMSQATIASYFNQMYDLAQGKKAATLFDEADTTEYPLAEVINQVLNFEYQPAKNGNNDVANGGADVALRNQVSQGGELRGNEPPASGEQTPTGTEPSDSGAGASDDSSTAGVEAVEGETPQSTDAAPATVQAAVEAASAEVNTEPTPAQAEAGNYKKGHITIGEFDITIENPAGSVRKGIDADGKEWSTTMANTYGYIKGTEGVDGDHIDVFLHENMDMWNGRKVYVVDQTNTDGSFDEHKVMLGFNNKDEAMSAYLANYDATWGQTHPGLRISETNIEDFNKWVQSSHRKTKPFADYSTVSKITDEAPVEQPTQPAAAITGEGYKVEPKPYTNKQGKTLDTYLVTFDRDFSKEELSTLRAKAKALKGWYDRETRGWMLRSADDAKAFAKDIVGKSEDEVADEAPLSLADMEKPASDKPKKAPVNRVNVEGVMADLSTKGETKLSDHAEPVEPTQTKPKKRRWISDEDADEFNNLRDNLRNHFGKGDDIVQESAEGYGKPQPKQMDAEVLRMGTRMTYLMMKGGLRSFADYCEAMIDELPDIFDDMRPHLKSLYAAAQNMEEVIELGWDEEMDDRKTVKAFDVYNFDKPGAKDIIATSQHIVDEQSSQQHTDQIIQTLKDQRNEQRKKEADETSADTEAIADKAEAVASKVESELEVATTEQDAERLSRDLDKEIEDVNKQLALLGYYEAVEDDSKFHESYGYMLTAEKKAVSDATNLAKQIVKDLGIDIKVTSATTPLGRKNVKKGTTVRANLAPAGGEIYITLPLNEGRHLKMYIGLEPVAEQDSRRRGDNLKTDRIMYRVEWPDEKGYVSFERIGRNCWAASNVTYDELLTAIRREARNYLPEDVVKPATPLTPQPGEDMVQMAERVAKLKAPKKSRIPDEQPMNDLFGGLFDEAEPKQDSAQFVKDMADMLERGESPFTVTPEVEAELAKQREAENNSTTPKNNSHEKTDVQARPETAGRGGQQPRPNEPLGTSAEHEAERTDGGRMAQRGGEHTVSDTKRGTGVSEQHKSERGVAQPKNIRNNHAERGVDYAPKGEKARIDANLAAIEVAKKLLASGETATPKEMEVLRRYSGWGGLGSAFNEGSTWSPNPINKRLREILTPEEYEAAVMSRNSAYYTPAPVIDAMWDIAKALGFKGGNIVEGSAGIGNIIGLMPTEISERSNIHAVEIDNTTGGILSLLYPDAKVEVQGFEKTRIANGSVDLAITNVPFVTGLHVMDESGDSDLSKKFRDIHDFCIAKNVRKLREGGIGIFITSSGTLDKSQKLRNWLVGDKEGCADVVGVFRMNNQTFGGTAATSDIIVVRKRVNGRKSANAIDISTVTPVRTASFEDDRGKTKDLPMLINRYFIEHPEYMGGEMFFGFEQGDTYRPTSMGLFPTRTADQPARMAAWVQHIAEMDWSKEQGTAVAEQTTHINEALGKDVKEGSMVTDSNGNLCVARMGSAVPLTFNKNKIKGRTKEQCFADYTDLKNALADVLKYQTEHNDDAGLQPLLDRLNSAYDTFVARYGNLNKNNNLAWLRNDVDFSSIVALETYSEKGSKDGTKIKTYGKTDIFSRRVVEKESEPAPKNVKDGIIASLYKYGRIDPEYLASQLGKSQADVKQEIIESGLGFENPTTGQMEVSYEYLSGNVREKLRQAREANEAANGAYDANIKALEAVVPMNIPAHLIEFTLGSSWVDPKLYERFVKERTDLNVRLTNAGGTWHMSEPYWTDEPKNKEMGIRSESLGILIPGHKLIEAAITNKTITVSKTTKNSDGTTTTETDAAATTACATKVDEIRQDFKDWAREQMQNDPELSMRMEEVYNEKFNNSVPKSIPDEFVPEHFGGAATMVGGRPFRLRPHQAKAVIRATTQPVLLAHEVGTGKTYTLITTAMEMRRLGTARKPMIVVQNATVGQFVASAKALYPNAKVLTLEDADRNAEGRKAFYAKIKFNDWDMIVVPQSVFERIPDSVERQTQFIQDKIEEKLLVLDQMKDADPDGRSMIVRAAERKIEKLKDEISQLANGGATDKKKEKDAKKAAVTRQNAEVKAREMLDRATDDVEDFDSMGIDAILVDEAHEYKHLGFATAMQRGVKGVDPSFSKKSQGVFLKTQSVLEKTGGKNVVFATGTPISNTAAEIWTFMRYLMPADVMKDYGIYYFDDFVRNFGNLQHMLEFSTSGKYKENNRFAGYVNLPELVRIWSTVADTVLTREAGGVSDKIPQMEGGKAQDIFLPQTRALRSIMKFVKEQLDAYDNMSGKEKKENSHIPLGMYGIAKAAAVDARLVQSDAEDDPNSKTNEAVRQTLRTLEEAKDYNGTVAIFADNYQNKVSGFNLYEDIRKKLISAGVPEEQIVVMKSGMTVNKKLEIFSRVNAGEVRVIMGSTFKLGTGVNIQERLHTLIHLDAPNRPMDYTQRNGRILRQGNLHNEWGIPVRVLRFGVEDSLDVTAYQRLKTKGAIADSIMNGKQLMENSMENRALEEDQDLFGDITAQLSGSEYAMLKNQIEKEVRKLTAQRKSWEADQTYIHNRKRQIAGQNKEAEKRIAENKSYLEKVEAATVGDITVGKLSYPSVEAMEDFFTEQNKRKAELQEQVRKSGYSSRPATSDITISVGGFNFHVHTEINRETKQGQQGDLFYSAPAKMTYSCPELGIEAMPVKGNVIKNAVTEILNDVVSGEDFRGRIEAAERSIERNNAELQSISARDGVPFKFTEELAKAEEKLSEYEDLMKAEMEAKEAKYAELDKEVEAASNIELTEEDSEDAASEPIASYSEENANFASRYETQDGKTINYTSENAEGYGGLFDFDFSGENAGGNEVGMRSGANDLQRQGDTGLNRHNSRLDKEAGEFSLIERVFRESGSFNFTSGEKIESADDVAFIFSALEDAAKEHSFVVLVKDGKPTVVELGMGTFTATMVDIPTASLAYNRIQPDQVYFVHNHPSGNLMCSPQDVQMLRKIADISKVPVHGVIINLKTGKYGTFDTDNTSGVGQKRVPENESPLAVHTLDKQIFAPNYDPMEQPLVRGSEDVAKFLNSQRMGDRAKMSFIILSRAGRIVGNIHTPFTKLPTKSDEIARYISERVIQFGGESAILYGDFTHEGSKMVAYRNLKDNLNKVGGTTLLDVVNVEGNNTRSANDDGLLYELGSEYGASTEAKSSHAERMSKKFNTPIRIVTDTKELTNDNSERQARMRRSKGFYDPATGEVVIVLPNNANVEDVAETVFHEVVAHKGLREMIGEENYDAFCDEIYNHLKDDLKQQVEEDATRRFVNEPGKEYEHHRRVAVDEMFGRMSEKGFEDFTKAERGIWVKLKAKVLEAINKFLGSLKLPKWVKLGDNELRYMLWRSHE
ncbi:helicase-related protein, partial [uncultured Muribaculum sp.]|uniref:helicase-related protein n=2 Tax=Pseudomonadati TaxID=3379134 RepID=UPI00272C9552